MTDSVVGEAERSCLVAFEDSMLASLQVSEGPKDLFSLSSCVVCAHHDNENSASLRRCW